MRLTFLFLICLCFSGKIHAQNAMGTGGLLLTPSAMLEKDGTLCVGGNHLSKAILTEKWDDDTYNYYVNLTFLPFLEVGYLLTFTPRYVQDGSWKKYSGQDRSICARLQVLKEREILPAFVLGGYDIYTSVRGKGNQYFSSLYGVCTKTLDVSSQKVELSLGYGIDGLKNTNMIGLFGGVSYQLLPRKQLECIAEYDSKRWNVALRTLWFRHLTTYVCIYDMEHPSAGLAYSFLLSREK